jgi:RimJ/RimL family protein N-acetyltransferase
LRIGRILKRTAWRRSRRPIRATARPSTSVGDAPASDIIALVIEVDRKVVGSIASWTNDGEREVTYWLGREYWGKGIATRALAQFLRGVERTRPIQASTARDNVGSQRVLEKCGFRRVDKRRVVRLDELDWPRF